MFCNNGFQKSLLPIINEYSKKEKKEQLLLGFLLKTGTFYESNVKIWISTYIKRSGKKVISTFYYVDLGLYLDESY